MSGQSQSVLPLKEVPSLRGIYDNGGYLSKSLPSEFQKFPASSRALDVVSIIQWDITKLEVDAIVNAANRRLLGGGGVDGAIHRAAGSDLLEECRTLNGCETGEAKITKGYELPAAHIVHTVGPIYDEYDEPVAAALLRDAYYNSIKVAIDSGLRSIAFCSISTGVYGYPIEDATHIALRTVREFVDSDEGSKMDRIIFVTFSGEDTEVYLDLAPAYFPYVEAEDVIMESQTVEASREDADQRPETRDAEAQTPLEATPPEVEVVTVGEDLPSGTRTENGVQTDVAPKALEPSSHDEVEKTDVGGQAFGTSATETDNRKDSE